jgi:hypothetical protein
MSWNDFITYLKSLIADPANAMVYASLRLKEVRQKKDQSVRDLVGPRANRPSHPAKGVRPAQSAGHAAYDRRGSYGRLV